MSNSSNNTIDVGNVDHKDAFISVPADAYETVRMPLTDTQKHLIRIPMAHVPWLISALEEECAMADVHIERCECGRVAPDATGYCNACFGG